jgi:hypothetical protein
MGTRADFYIGRGKSAEWLGSIAWGGYPESIDKKLLKAKTKDNFVSALNKFFKGRDDVTLPKDGWPWPWDDSNTTDFSYAFDDGKVYATCFGSHWFDPLIEQSDECQEREGKSEFPNMKNIKNIAFNKRSGLIIIGPTKD